MSVLAGYLGGLGLGEGIAVPLPSFDFFTSYKGNGHDTTWRNSGRARSQKSRSNRRKAMRRKHK